MKGTGAGLALNRKTEMKTYIKAIRTGLQKSREPEPEPEPAGEETTRKRSGNIGAWSEARIGNASKERRRGFEDIDERYRMGVMDADNGRVEKGMANKIKRNERWSVSTA